MEAYKTCKCCGKEYITEQGFTATTTLVGIQSFAPYNLLSLELRDCSCGTTLARKINPNLKKQLVAA